MELLKSPRATLCLDERWPRIVWYESPDGNTRIPGERDAAAPRLYLFRKKDRAQLTTDDDNVRATYQLRVSGAAAIYHARVTCDGKPAVELDVAIRLQGADAAIRLENVREFPGYCFLTIRFRRVIAASSRDADGRLVTCGGQGRLFDPAKCKPNMTDYSWHFAVARPCGAAYRARFMVTLDVTGYEDLFIHEVRQDTRIADAETIASLGAELMYRQRNVADPQSRLQIAPQKNPSVGVLAEPLLCGGRREVRLHFLAARKGRTLDWTDAAKYFQSLLPKRARCNPLYDNALVYKILLTLVDRPLMTLEQAGDIVRRIGNLTDGMPQVCYFLPCGRGCPRLTIDAAVGDRRRLRRVMAEARRRNTIVSFHDLLTQADVGVPAFDPDMAARDALGRQWDALCWDGVQLVQISTPHYLPELKKTVARLVREYGIHATYHLDTLSCLPFVFDAHPRRRFNATQYNQANWELLKEFNRHGIDVTSEGLTHPYVGRIGHVWALFNTGTTAEGEERIPFANFIYHGAISWNVGHASSGEDDRQILEALVQGGGAAMEFRQPLPSLENWPAIVDSLYLIHPVYAALRNRKWIGYRRTGTVRRVDYASTSLSTSASTPLSAGGRGSFIEVDDAKPGYRVVVDGRMMAQDFATVYPGRKRGTYLAFSRVDRELDWPAPEGWRSGAVPAVALTESGPGAEVPARIDKGRLRLHLRAHQPVRLGPRR